MKVKIVLKNKQDGEHLTIYNEIFNTNNGIAFFEIETHKWELLDYRPLVFTSKKGDFYEGDKVRVKGIKTVGVYETEIVRDMQGWTLKENKTYLNNDRCFISIIEKI